MLRTEKEEAEFIAKRTGEFIEQRYNLRIPKNELYNVVFEAMELLKIDKKDPDPNAGTY